MPALMGFLILLFTEEQSEHADESSMKLREEAVYVGKLPRRDDTVLPSHT